MDSGAPPSRPVESSNNVEIPKQKQKRDRPNASSLPEHAAKKPKLAEESNASWPDMVAKHLVKLATEQWITSGTISIDVLHAEMKRDGYRYTKAQIQNRAHNTKLVKRIKETPRVSSSPGLPPPPPPPSLPVPSFLPLPLLASLPVPNRPSADPILELNGPSHGHLGFLSYVWTANHDLILVASTHVDDQVRFVLKREPRDRIQVQVQRNMGPRLSIAAIIWPDLAPHVDAMAATPDLHPDTINIHLKLPTVDPPSTCLDYSQGFQKMTRLTIQLGNHQGKLI